LFDVSWSELLILGVVTLIFVGPKELPVFLRTIGRYAGVLRRHAAEFRAQFDEAMREAELDQIKNEIQSVRDDLHQTVHAAERSVKSEVEGARREIEKPVPASTEPASAEPEEHPLRMIPAEVALRESAAASAPATVEPPPAAEPAQPAGENAETPKPANDTEAIGVGQGDGESGRAAHSGSR
jgi:sec-independent protein translocase protein TatB